MASRPRIIYVGGMSGSAAGSTSDDVFILTGLTGGIASSPNAGDFAIVAAATASTAQRSYRIDGYTEIASLYSDSTQDTNLWVGRKSLTAADTDFTITGGSGSAGDPVAVCAMVFRHVNALSPFNSPIETDGGAGKAESSPISCTLTSDIDSCAVAVGAGAHDKGTITYTKDPNPPVDHFLTLARSGTSGDLALGMIAKFLNSGSTNFPVLRIGGLNFSSESHADVSFAIKRA